MSRKVYGIYKSDDEGRTWNPLSNDLEGIAIAALDFSRDEKIMYAAAGNWDEGGKEQEGKISHKTGGLYKSEDGGKTWQRILSGAANAVVINPKNSDIVYGSTHPSNPLTDDKTGWKGRGIIRSIDGGKTWECIGNKINPSLLCVALDPYDPSIIYGGSGAWKGIDGYVKNLTGEKTEGKKSFWQRIFPW